MVKYIQNLDAILAVLKRVDITITVAKSQFCYSGIKIVDYICDSSRWHPNTSKVLKILDWPEYIDVITA